MSKKSCKQQMVSFFLSTCPRGTGASLTSALACRPNPGAPLFSNEDLDVHVGKADVFDVIFSGVVGNTKGVHDEG